MSGLTLDKNGIIPIWQPIGSSTHIIAKKVSEKLQVKTSHTGTLDPMAEGVIIVLSGETRNLKYEYAKWLKTYEFEIAFGISTDTYDGMGLITNHNFNIFFDKNFINNLSEKLPTLVGSYTQKVPLYSAIKLDGKELHNRAKLNLQNKSPQELEKILPTKSGQIFSLKLLKSYNESLEKINFNLEKKINLVEGDFRQTEIIKSWHEFLSKNSNITLSIARIEVQMTKGLYVRSLATDIARLVNQFGFVYDLVRTKNGNYTKENSFNLSDILK